MHAWEGQAIMGTIRTAHRAAALVIGSIFVLAPAAAREISLDERAAAAKAIEQVYYSHRTWPEANSEPKPPLDAIAPEAAFRSRVLLALRESARLEAIRRRPPTGDELQAEIDRMVASSKAPETLRELFAALSDDPDLIAECLARPALEARLLADVIDACDIQEQIELQRRLVTRKAGHIEQPFRLQRQADIAAMRSAGDDRIGEARQESCQQSIVVSHAGESLYVAAI